MQDLIMVYITVQDKNDVGNIARELVEDGLAACTNVIQNVSSVYRWEGTVEEAKETIIIAKTVSSKFDQLVDKVKLLHSSACPCIVSMPIVSGNTDYLNWLREAVKV